MLFQELIDDLKKVKTEKDFTPALVDELMNAAIITAYHTVIESRECSMTDALEVSRMTLLKHFDAFLFDAWLDQETNPSTEA